MKNETKVAGGGICGTIRELVLAKDGAWTWFNDPRALFHKGRLYFGYVKRATSRPALSVYDPATGRITELFEIHFSCDDRDDHDNPAIVVLPSGKLFVSAAPHNFVPRYSFYYRVSRNTAPLLTDDWESQGEFEHAQTTSYQNLFVLSGENGRLYNFHRSIGWNPCLTVSDDEGRTWSTLRRFIGTEKRSRPYVKFASNGIDRIDVIYTDGHPNETPSNSVYHCYIRNGRVHRTDGSVIKPLADLPLCHDKGERGSLIYDCLAPCPASPFLKGQAWIIDIAHDAEGNPICLFQTQQMSVGGEGWKGIRISYHYAGWKVDHGWQTQLIGQAGRPLYEKETHYAGGMAIDAADPRIIYISSNAADPFDHGCPDVPLGKNERYEIYRGVMHDDSTSFEWTPVTAGSATDNIRPYVPRGSSPGSALLWLNGSYDSYTDFYTRVMGRFDGSVHHIAR